jgi:hypothetical protein
MDHSLVGTVIASLAFLPWMAEVVFQVRLQARFLDLLPEAARAALPRHPRRPALAFLGSPRFALAVWRSFRHDEPGDPEPLLALKAHMRASLRRELVWALAGFGALAALLRAGWRLWG